MLACKLRTSRSWLEPFRFRAKKVQSLPGNGQESPPGRFTKCLVVHQQGIRLWRAIPFTEVLLSRIRLSEQREGLQTVRWLGPLCKTLL